MATSTEDKEKDTGHTLDADVDLPRILEEIAEFTVLQLAGGVSAAEVFQPCVSGSQRKSLKIRKRFAKNKRIDLSRYKPAEVLQALLGFLASSEPIIPEELFCCFSAVVQLGPEFAANCMRGLLKQLLPYERSVLHYLARFCSRLITEQGVSAQLLGQRFAPTIIVYDSAEKVLRPADVFQFMIVHYEDIYVNSGASVDLGKILHAVVSATENNGSFSDTTSSSAASSFSVPPGLLHSPSDSESSLADSCASEGGTMIVRASPTRPTVAEVFDGKENGNSSDSEVGYGTMVVRDSPERRAAQDIFDDDDSGFGTMVVRETETRPSASDVFAGDEDDDEEGGGGTMVVRLPKKKASAEPVAAAAPVKSRFYREPDQWEKNIIALEKGEWSEGMGADAFRRWNKQRPRMPSFRHLSPFEDVQPQQQQQQQPAAAAAAAPLSVSAPEMPAPPVPLEPQLDVSDLLEKMNLPEQPDTIQFAQSFARASVIFKDFATFRDMLSAAEKDAGELSQSSPAAPRSRHRRHRHRKPSTPVPPSGKSSRSEKTPRDKKSSSNREPTTPKEISLI